MAREPSLDCYDVSVSNEDMAIVLDLGAIDDATELEPPYAEVRAIAATVLLERNHGPRESDPTALHHEDHCRSAQLIRRAVTPRADLTYDEPIQATEEAAEAVAFLVARRVLNRIAYARCRTRTGADYRLRRPGAADSDSYERLEVSGIGGGTERAASRLREKLTRLAEYPRGTAGLRDRHELPRRPG